jgi:hypothetical protein
MTELEQFKAYERVRASGVTNMFDVTRVMQLSRLTKAEILHIMSNYTQLMEKYPEVRK